MQTTAPIALNEIKNKILSPCCFCQIAFLPKIPILLSQSYLFFGLEDAAFLTDCSFVDNVLVPPDPNQETVGRRSKFSSCRRKVKREKEHFAHEIRNSKNNNVICIHQQHKHCVCRAVKHTVTDDHMQTNAGVSNVIRFLGIDRIVMQVNHNVFFIKVKKKN